MILLGLLGVVVLAALWVVSTYNFFVSSLARLKAAVQEIANQLKRQADLIPNLESSVKGYLKQEKDIFQMLTDARKAVAGAVESGDVNKMSAAGSQVAGLIPQLKVAVESNPELKSSDVVAKLMDELRDTADKLMYARRLFIDLTADFNVRRATFPSSFVATMFSFGEQPGLITNEEETKTPKIDLGA